MPRETFLPIHLALRARNRRREEGRDFLRAIGRKVGSSLIITSLNINWRRNFPCYPSLSRDSAGRERITITILRRELTATRCVRARTRRLLSAKRRRKGERRGEIARLNGSLAWLSARSENSHYKFARPATRALLGRYNFVYPGAFRWNFRSDLAGSPGARAKRRMRRVRVETAVAERAKPSDRSQEVGSRLHRYIFFLGGSRNCETTTTTTLGVSCSWSSRSRAPMMMINDE